MLTLREIMTRDVVTIPPELSVRAAMDVLATHHISGAPVVVGDDVVGVVSATDLLDLARSLPGVPTARPVQEEPGAWEPAEEEMEGDEPPSAYFTEMWPDAGAELEERFAETRTPEWDPLEEHVVSEVMSRRVCSLPPSATVTAAADAMRRLGIHRVLVTQAGRLLGVVTAHDVAKAVAEGRAVERRLHFDASDRFDERGWQ
ncbi:MAG: CBS domain-containing protein [Gemmatimonadaceae bacterium]|nr:CBS domain-containing protein [Gemmatimonadaceae bacterium]